MRHRVLSVLLAVVAALVFASSQAARADGPSPSSGINDWSCRPSAEHLRPVVLLHGFMGNAEGNWSYLGPLLASRGYCVFWLDYGGDRYGLPIHGTGPLRESADEIGTFIDDVRTATGSSQVDLVGHSEGGFLALYVTKVRGYAPKIGTLVALSPPTHGVSIAGLATAGRPSGVTAFAAGVLAEIGCEPCPDLVPGGPAVAELNDGPVAVTPGPAYTVIASRFDTLITPEAALIDEPGVHNIVVQDVCPADPVGHIGMAFDPTVAAMVTNALDPANTTPVACSVCLPV